MIAHETASQALTDLKETMKSNLSKLTKDVHVRIPEQLQQMIYEVANQNHMRPSSLCRVILARELPNYTRNRFFG